MSSPAIFLISCFEAGSLLCEFAGEPGEHLPVDGDAAPLHVCEHGEERPLQRLVNGEHALGRKPRLEHLPQPQHDVGLLGGIGRCLVDADGVKADPRLAGLDERVDVGDRVGERAFGERFEAMVLPAGIERVRHQHGVVIGGDLGAAQRQHLPGEFQVVADLEHAPVGKKRPQGVERRAFGNLVGGDVAAEQAGAAALAAPAMTERHVAGLVRRHGKREAAQLRLHRIAARGADIDGDNAEVARALDPGVEPIETAHRLIFAAIELGVARGLHARAGERLRREHALRGRFGFRFAQIGRLRRPGEGELRRRAFSSASARGLSRRGRALRVVLPGSRERRKSAGKPRVRLDLARLDVGELGDAAHQRIELHRLEEGDQPLVVGLVHGEIADRHVELHLVVESDELLRQPRLLGVVDQRLPALVLLDLGSTGEQRFEVAIFADELRRGLDADPGYARHVVGRIADQRLHLDDLLRRHAEFLDHLGAADLLVLHGVEHDDAVIDELHQVLVRGDDGGGGAGCAGLAHIGRDQVVGLEAVLFQAGNVEGVDRLADELELRAQIVGRIGPVRLVVGIHLRAEGLLRLVEDHREMRRLVLLHVAQELPQHVAEAEYRVELQPVRLAVDRRQRVIGAKNVAGAIDEEDVVALLHRQGGRLGFLCGGHDAR